MRTEPSTAAFALAAQDVMVAAAARDSFATWLPQLAKRRAARYADPSVGPADPKYWPEVARALAPVAPPETMPMHGVIEEGATLEGGARGLRGLFTSNPSEKDRKRVQRVAALVSRVLQIVASTDASVTDDERRCAAMAMASFGLSDDELAAATPTAGLSVDQFELHGEVELKIRREVLRGAWQFALREALAAPAEQTLRTLAAKLELGAEEEAIKARAQETLARLGATATLALELVRYAGEGLDEKTLDAAATAMIRASSSPARAALLRARLAQKSPVDFEAPGVMQKPQRLQAVSLAWAALASTNPSYAWSMQLRARLAEGAASAGCGYELDQGVDVVDRYLLAQAREAEAPAPAPATAPRETSGEG
ncbi:MAG: hypothetical protein R3A52_31080 [Polyangiales bacterium]